MQMFGEVVDAAGTVRARAEGPVEAEGDLVDIVKTVMFEYREANPDTLLLKAIADHGCEIRFGRV